MNSFKYSESKLFVKHCVIITVRFFLIILQIIFKISFKTLSESAVFSVNRFCIIFFI